MFLLTLFLIDNNLAVMFWRLQARVLMLNRLRAFWPKGYQRGSLGKPFLFSFSHCLLQVVAVLMALLLSFRAGSF